MAIDMSEFTDDVEAGLKANKNFTRFFYRFKADGTTKRRILDYSNKDWDKRTRIAKAKADLAAEKNKQVNTGVNFT